MAASPNAEENAGAVLVVLLAAFLLLSSSAALARLIASSVLMRDASVMREREEKERVSNLCDCSNNVAI